MEIISCFILLVHIVVRCLVWCKWADPLRRRWHILVQVWWLRHLLIHWGRHHGLLLIKLALLLRRKHILVVIVDWIRAIICHVVVLDLHFIQVFVYVSKS